MQKSKAKLIIVFARETIQENQLVQPRPEGADLPVLNFSPRSYSQVSFWELYLGPG